MAAVVIRTGVGPTDLLAAPPQVFTAIEVLLDQQEKQQRRQDRIGKMRERLRASHARAKGA